MRSACTHERSPSRRPGVIGVLLPGERVAAAIPSLAAALRPEGGPDFALAIRTTDVLDKHAALEVSSRQGAFA